ncbi:MAG: DUF1501 domain-containing protein [Candidatus Poribacteria bacterium]|jgi:hypothetical protein|nr:DUF1501 domain-containing protein [Candidatus Poribacteria bacterium]MDP6747526.1 DUF1501 domain-containing protein [Candidatus Poribacteria bacterium]MDP6997691.1 DUF1501 domain-containing protein [Candidatus Poribacteria bacterium]
MKMLNPAYCQNIAPNYSRRKFLTQTSLGLGAAALSFLSDPTPAGAATSTGVLGKPHMVPKAKRVIYLFQSGAPSQLETFDYKPRLRQLRGQDLPESVRRGQRLTGMTSGQATFPLTNSIFTFAQHGQSGAWISELLPHTAEIVDKLCFIKSIHTEAINHDPASTFLQTGSQLPGRPSIGSWLSYGLGSTNDNLPNFVVLVTKNKNGQPLYARLWGNGFLPSQHQGVQFRAGKNPVLYLNNPDGIDKETRGHQIDYLRQLQEIQYQKTGDAEVLERLAQYEMAFRMQTSVPEATDVSDEPESTFESYGPDSREPGTYAANCLLARRLIERGVRFVQLYHRGWDHHGGLPANIRRQCQETDQPSAALVADLEQRGLLDDTLVIWGGEFGRTCYSQGRLTETNYGRDHHPRCFSLWMAGGGIKAGYTHGQTDDFSYNVVENPVHIHDFQATLLHLLGIDHEQLTFKFQGRRYRLTDVHGKIIQEVLA